jgi:hypothetical protein
MKIRGDACFYFLGLASHRLKPVLPRLKAVRFAKIFGFAMSGEPSGGAQSWAGGTA